VIPGLSGGGSLLAAGGLLLALLAAVFFMRRSATSQGRAEGRLEGQKVIVEQTNKENAATQQRNEEVLAQVEEVHEIHDRLDADPAYRQRVRDRFTRPD